MDDLLVSYDVASDKRRRKLFKLLHRWGAPLQKSVFRCRVHAAGFERMRREAEKLIDFETDSVLYVFLCPRCLERVVQAGKPLDVEAAAVKVL